MKKIILVLMILSVVICMVGCGNKSEADYSNNDYFDTSYIDGTQSGDVGVEMNNGNLVIDGITSGGKSPSYDVSVGAGGSSNSSNNSSTNTNTLPSVNNQQNYTNKVIKNFEIQSETKEFNQAIVSLNNLLSQVNGYIENSSITNRKYTNYSQQVAKYSIRVPSDLAEDFVNGTSSFVHVTSSQSKVTDISLEYNTLKRNLETVEKERVALQAMLEKATSTNEILNIRNQLTNIIKEIETMETKLAIYDSQVSYSTIKINIYEVVDYTVQKEEPKFLERLGTAIVESWSSFVDGMGNFVIWFVYAFPALLIIGGLIAAVLAVYFKAKKLDPTQPKKKKIKKKDNSNQPNEEQFY